MRTPDPAVIEGLREQLDAWRTELDRGAERVGWKIGLNAPAVLEALGLTEPVVGHLTSATRRGCGAEYPSDGAVALRAEMEVAVRVGAGLEAVAFAAAIEFVDVGRPPAGIAGILAGNVFHRAFVLGPEAPEPPPLLSLTIGDRAIAADQPVPDFAATIELVARSLLAAGEELAPGDWIITGALASDAVAPGETVVVNGTGAEPLSLTVSAAAA